MFEKQEMEEERIYYEKKKQNTYHDGTYRRNIRIGIRMWAEK